MKKVADGFEYEIRADGTAELLRFTKEMSRLVIPAQIEGIPVKRISDHFATRREDLIMRRDCLEEAVISEGVEEIGFQAFAYCPNLRTVKIPASVTRIDTHLVYHSGVEKVYDPVHAQACTDYHLWRELGGCIYDEYSEEYTTSVIAPKGSAAEKYCRENQIPCTAKGK